MERGEVGRSGEEEVLGFEKVLSLWLSGKDGDLNDCMMRCDGFRCWLNVYVCIASVAPLRNVRNKASYKQLKVHDR